MSDVKFVWSEGGGEPLPDGMHYAVYKGVEQAPEREFDGKKSPGVRWQFEVQSGPFKGRRIGRITGVNPSEKSACGKIIAGLLGKTPKPGEPCDPSACVGKTYAIVVAGNKVEAVSVPPAQ